MRLLNILSGCALLAANDVFGLWLSERNEHDARLEQVRGWPRAVQMFKAQSSHSGVGSVQILPLVVEAQAFEQHLNPPKTAERLPRFARNDMASSTPPANPAPSAPVVQPPAPSVRFRLCATSYYPNEPGRSMALVSDVGSAEGDQRWVKEGAKLGHFVVHEIRRGRIVYRDGEQLR